MKLKTTFTLLICSFLFCQNINAQSFVDEGNQWTIVTFSFNGNANNTSYLIEGDSLINGVIYKKMWRTYENPNANNWVLPIYIREDSTKKVFQFNGVNNENLIYDFGIEIGDTLASSYIPTEYATVEAIDSILLNDGTKRKRLDLISITCPNFNDDEYWIDEIGGINHALTFIHEFCITDVSAHLQCFSKNGDLLYGPRYGEQCFIINSTNELKQNALKIFPNPTQNILNLEYDENIKIEKVNIFDFQGQVIKSLPIENQISQINISDIPNGVYFIKIETQNEQFVFKKFIKI